MNIRRGMKAEGDVTTHGENDPPEDSLAIWSTYYDQADPIVIFKDGEWCNMTAEMLGEALNGK